MFAQTKNRTGIQGKSRISQTASVEAELKKLEREWFDAVVKGDAETLNRIFADDFTAINNDGSFVNKVEMKEMMSAGRLKLDEIKTDEFKLRLYGNTALVTGARPIFAIKSLWAKAATSRPGSNDPIFPGSRAGKRFPGFQYRSKHLF